MKIKPLIICHSIIALLLITFFWPFTRAYWDVLDLACFKFLNSTLVGHPKWQLFWALTNHKLTDWVEDLVFISFFAVAIRAAPRGQRLQRAAQFLFTILYAACIIFFVNRMLFREHLDIPRSSPTLVVQDCVRLSDEIPWMKIKDDASSSFPGDHGTTLFLFAASYAFYSGRKFGFYAFLYAAFRTLPRLIAGAHWATDVLIGSSVITLFYLSWAFCTPLHLWVTERFEAFLKLFSRKKEPARP